MTETPEITPAERTMLEALDDVWDPLYVLHLPGSRSLRSWAAVGRSLQRKGLAACRSGHGPHNPSGMGQWAITPAGDRALGRDVPDGPDRRRRRN